METRCGYSVLTIPNDLSYTAVAERYVREVSVKMGFDGDELDEIGRAVSEAVRTVIGRAFEPWEKGEFSISCERVPTGLRIILKDKGLPVDPGKDFGNGAAEGGVGDKPAGVHGIPLMRRLVNELSFHNLGREGKELHLTKYLKRRSIEDYVAACDLEPYEPPSPVKPRRDEEMEFHVRLMKSEEAIEVARCVYRSYGYSYFYPAIYYPDRMVAFNESGHVISAVALANDGNVAGHCSLFRSDLRAPIAEIGQAVVKPEYRGQGCLAKLTEFVIREGKSRGLTGTFVEAVTNHTFSQRIVERLGFHNCGIKLAYAPSSVSFKGIQERLSQRETFTVDYQYLKNPDCPTLYPPPRHRSFIAELYGNLGAAPPFSPPHRCRSDYPEGPSVLETKTALFAPEGYAVIEVKRYGYDIVRQVSRELTKLKLQRYDAVELDLDLADPLTCRVTEEFERLGFFFSGILPGASGRETLMLQYLNNVVIDYDRIKVYSEAGRAALDYVKGHDPNYRPA
ncbi:MAG: GNAT family N-acetyltransferase [Pseudomonadota bacterium]